MLTSLPENEVKALIDRLQKLITGLSSEPLVTQPSQEDLTKATEMKWEAVASGQVPHPDAMKGGGITPTYGGRGNSGGHRRRAS